MSDRSVKILRLMVTHDENRYCFECHQRGPTYVDVTIGSFICTQCAGALRKYHHRIKAISMSGFTENEMDIMCKRGNKACKKIYLASAGDECRERSNTDPAFDEFLRQKYVVKKWFAEPSAELESEALRENQRLIERGELSMKQGNFKRLGSIASAGLIVSSVRPTPKPTADTIIKPPEQSQQRMQSSDLFGLENKNAPFGLENKNAPFGLENKSDPFGWGNKSDPFGSENKSDPFGSGNKSNPFGSGNKSDPFGSGNKSDPFGWGNKSDPFGSDNKNDPFGSGNKCDPFGSGNKNDPFAPALLPSSDPTAATDLFSLNTATSISHAPSDPFATVSPTSFGISTTTSLQTNTPAGLDSQPQDKYAALAELDDVFRSCATTSAEPTTVQNTTYSNPGPAPWLNNSTQSKADPISNVTDQLPSFDPFANLDAFGGFAKPKASNPFLNPQVQSNLATVDRPFGGGMSGSSTYSFDLPNQHPEFSHPIQNKNTNPFSNTINVSSSASHWDTTASWSTQCTNVMPNTQTSTRMMNGTQGNHGTPDLTWIQNITNTPGPF